MEKLGTENIYIGDGVYASIDGYHVILSTERDGRTEKIYMDEKVLSNFENYIKYLKEKNG